MNVDTSTMSVDVCEFISDSDDSEYSDDNKDIIEPCRWDYDIAGHAYRRY